MPPLPIRCAHKIGPLSELVKILDMLKLLSFSCNTNEHTKRDLKISLNLTTLIFTTDQYSPLHVIVSKPQQQKKTCVVNDCRGNVYATHHPSKSC